MSITRLRPSANNTRTPSVRRRGARIGTLTRAIRRRARVAFVRALLQEGSPGPSFVSSAVFSPRVRYFIFGAAPLRRSLYVDTRAPPADDVLVKPNRKGNYTVKLEENFTRICELPESRRSPPPMDIRNPGGVTCALPVSWKGIGYLMKEGVSYKGGSRLRVGKWINRGGSGPPEFSFTGRNVT
ncbi:hypothetical protein EVAR_74743_1 [Eumeta japonica]|uniref:Uncharacterized protein n=1 Tax=Eumeta variegata TaxID=151549 RepID=A0A4C1SRI4_EUMVA|nr:hypothetical protein EVAR_74743_1 [Eumeta japonica]